MVIISHNNYILGGHCSAHSLTAPNRCRWLLACVLDEITLGLLVTGVSGQLSQSTLMGQQELLSRTTAEQVLKAKPRSKWW